MGIRLLSACCCVLAVSLCPAAELKNLEVPFEHGTFFIKNFSVNGSGTEKRLKIQYQGTLVNNTKITWDNVTFCLETAGTNGEPLQRGEDPCLTHFWVSRWAPSQEVFWKQKLRTRVGDSKRKITVGGFRITVKDFREHSENTQFFSHTCEQVWPVALRTLVGENFQPVLADKDTLLATFKYEGPRIMSSNVNNWVKAYTTARARWLQDWEGFRFNTASFSLHPAPNYQCRGEMKITMAAYNEGQGWFTANSNNRREKEYWSKVSDGLSTAVSESRSLGIENLPSSGEKSTLVEDSESESVPTDTSTGISRFDGPLTPKRPPPSTSISPDQPEAWQNDYGLSDEHLQQIHEMVERHYPTPTSTSPEATDANQAEQWKNVLQFSMSDINKNYVVVDPKKPDFRKVKWGMSVADVMAAEAQPEDNCLLENEPNNIVTWSCQVTITSLDTLLRYQFVNDQLANGSYSFKKRYIAPNRALSDMVRWLTPLKEKYGESEPTINWINRVYADQGEEHFGTAISMGHLTMQYSWDTERTRILLALQGEDFETALLVTYTSRQLGPLIEGARQKEEEDLF